MSLREALIAALSSLADHTLRAILTTLGVIFGVAAVISMLSIGAGAEQEALELIRQLGVRNVIVQTKELGDRELAEARRRSPGLTMRDRQAILDAVPGVELVAPRAKVRTWRVASGRRTVDANVFGLSDEQAQLVEMSLSEGRFLDRLDVESHAQVGVLGSEIADELFGDAGALGELLKINDVWIEVVGVLAGAGEGEGAAVQGVSFESPTRSILVPVSTALRKFDQRPSDSPLSELVVRLGEGEGVPSSQAAARLLQSLLDQLHSGADDFELVVPDALLEQSRQTQRLFNLVMGFIAGISLVVGGIGIMNIMLATVLERTREIGLRRAVGARKRDIVIQFLTESFAISALGALLGVVLGVVLSRLISAAADWPTIITAFAVLTSVGVALTVGVVAGLYPALRAADLDPVDALRYE
ncbi:MAG: ABC transporter permease [Acidobacteriota bacterium]